MFSPVQEASVSIYLHARHILLRALSLRTSDRNVHRTFASSYSPFWFEWRSFGWRQTAAHRRYGWTRLRTFPEILRARAESRLESKSTFECARKHSKINDLCDTRERVRGPSACLPGCSAADGGCGTERRKETQTARGNSFATFLMAHCPCFSVTEQQAVLRNYWPDSMDSAPL